MSENRWTYIGSFLAMLTLQSTDAAACWIGHVEQTAKGIDVYFSSVRRVEVTSPGSRPRRYIAFPVNADRVDLYDNETPEMVVAGVPAVVGDKLSSANSHHDFCRLTVVMKDGKIGLEADAHTHLPGLPPVSSKTFIPAK